MCHGFILNLASQVGLFGRLGTMPFSTSWASAVFPCFFVPPAGHWLGLRLEPSGGRDASMIDMLAAHTGLFPDDKPMPPSPGAVIFPRPGAQFQIRPSGSGSGHYCFCCHCPTGSDVREAPVPPLETVQCLGRLAIVTFGSGPRCSGAPSATAGTSAVLIC